jgi:hypothetical protein
VNSTHFHVPICPLWVKSRHLHQPMFALPPRADNRLHFSHTEGASWVMARVLCSRSRLSLRHQYNVWTTFVTSVGLVCNFCGQVVIRNSKATPARRRLESHRLVFRLRGLLPHQLHMQTSPRVISGRSLNRITDRVAAHFDETTHMDLRFLDHEVHCRSQLIPATRSRAERVPPRKPRDENNPCPYFKKTE